MLRLQVIDLSPTLRVSVRRAKNGLNYALFERATTTGSTIKTVIFYEELMKLARGFAEVANYWANNTPRWIPLSATKILFTRVEASTKYIGVEVAGPSGRRKPGTGFNLINEEPGVLGSRVMEIALAVSVGPTPRTPWPHHDRPAEPRMPSGGANDPIIISATPPPPKMMRVALPVTSPVTPFMITETPSPLGSPYMPSPVVRPYAVSPYIPGPGTYVPEDQESKTSDTTEDTLKPPGAPSCVRTRSRGRGALRPLKLNFSLK